MSTGLRDRVTAERIETRKVAVLGSDSHARKAVRDRPIWLNHAGHSNGEARIASPAGYHSHTAAEVAERGRAPFAARAAVAAVPDRSPEPRAHGRDAPRGAPLPG